MENLYFTELIMIKVRVTAAQRGEIDSIADIFPCEDRGCTGGVHDHRN